MDLWKHQEETVARIHADAGVHALLHEPGAGKTLTVLAYLQELQAELARPIRVLVVVPKSALGVWPEQVKLYCNDESWRVDTLSGPIKSRLLWLQNPEHLRPPGILGDVHLAVLPYSTFQGFRTKAAAKPVLDAVRAYAPDVVVLDEAHAIRGAQSNTSKVFGMLSPLCPRRLVLTGTPTPHGPEDIYGIWRFLDPSAFAGPTGNMVSYIRFLDGYAIMGGFQGRQIVGWRDQDDLKERISRRSSVVKTADCHDLPPLIIQKHSFALSPAEQKCYDEMRRDMLTIVEDETIAASNKLVSILRLRQVTSGFLPLEMGGAFEIGTTRRDLAVELVSDLLASEKRVVVFAWSRHEVEAVHSALDTNRPWGPETAVFKIDGSTPTHVREGYLASFASENPNRMVLVAQIDTVNSGTNALVGASHAVYLSLTNRGEVFTQSLARLHRPGQTAQKVVAHVLQASGTIDCTMLDCLQGRADEQSALMQHIREANR